MWQEFVSLLFFYMLSHYNRFLLSIGINSIVTIVSCFIFIIRIYLALKTKYFCVNLSKVTAIASNALHIHSFGLRVRKKSILFGKKIRRNKFQIHKCDLLQELVRKSI